MGITILALAAAVLASPAAHSAAPAAASDPITRHVEYGDLDLASAAGARSLRLRVGEAVHDLCREASGPDNGSADFRFAMMRCEKRAWREARPQLAGRVDASRSAARQAGAIATAIRISAAPAR